MESEPWQVVFTVKINLSHGESHQSMVVSGGQAQTFFPCDHHPRNYKDRLIRWLYCNSINALILYACPLSVCRWYAGLKHCTYMLDVCTPLCNIHVQSPLSISQHPKCYIDIHFIFLYKIPQHPKCYIDIHFIFLYNSNWAIYDITMKEVLCTFIHTPPSWLVCLRGHTVG